MNRSPPAARRLASAIASRCFFAALFLAYGVVVPYFPVWLHARGLDPLADIDGHRGAAVRPPAGHAGHRPAGRPPRQLPPGRPHRHGVERAGAGPRLAVSSPAYWAILALGVVFLLANGTMLAAHRNGGRCAACAPTGLDYGRMRLWGSITFIVANFVGGVAIEALGGGFAHMADRRSPCLLTIGAAHALPAPPRGAYAAVDRAARAQLAPCRSPGAAARARACSSCSWWRSAARTARTPRSTRFGALHWQSQGLPAAWVGALWAIGVFAEVVLFAFSAPRWSAASDRRS